MTEEEGDAQPMSNEHVTVCGEIEYDTPEGGIHSDICLVHDGEYRVPPDVRAFLHGCLDEWLDNSRGSGMFWIGDPTVRDQSSAL